MGSLEVAGWVRSCSEGVRAVLSAGLVASGCGGGVRRVESSSIPPSLPLLRSSTL